MFFALMKGGIFKYARIRDKKMSTKQTLTWRKGKYRIITIVICWHEAKYSAYYCKHLMFLSLSNLSSW